MCSKPQLAAPCISSFIVVIAGINLDRRYLTISIVCPYLLLPSIDSDLWLHSAKNKFLLYTLFPLLFYHILLTQIISEPGLASANLKEY